MQAFKCLITTGEFVIDVLGWDGETQPDDGLHFITSAETCGQPEGDATAKPISGAYLHKFVQTDAGNDPRVGYWVEGDPDAAAKNQARDDATHAAAVNGEAQSRIIASLPSGEPSNFIIKEINMLARMLELRDIKDDRALTTNEQNEYAGMKAVWDGVKNIRATAKTAKTDKTPVDQITW